MVLAALLLGLQLQAEPTARRPDLTYGFTTERLEIDLTQPSQRHRWAGEKYDQVPSLRASGLVMDCAPGSVLHCELQPTNLHGRVELFLGTVAEVPAGCGLRIEARTLRSEEDPEPGAWTCAFQLGSPSSGTAQTESGRRSIEVLEGHIRVLEADPRLQLRLVASNSSSSRASVTVDRVCYAGFDRSSVSAHEWGVMRGGCGLAIGDWAETERRFRERSHHPLALEFCGAPDIAAGKLEASSSAACLVMLLPHKDEVDRAQCFLSRIKTTREFVEPGAWLSLVHERGEEGTLECYSIWPEVEMVLGGAGPFAIRVQDSSGSRAWVVLSSFEGERNALIYDPTSNEAQPVRWTRDELEKRWFGAGGLAFKIRR